MVQSTEDFNKAFEAGVAIPLFQCELFIAKAIDYKDQYLSPPEAQSFLQQACNIMLQERQWTPDFFKIVRQNRVLIEFCCAPSGLLNEIMQFPFTVARQLPTRLFTGVDGSTIKDASFDRNQFKDHVLPYATFEEWMLANLSAFASDPTSKGSLMIG